MTPQYLDRVWISCIVIANVLYFVQKGIVAIHGGKTSLLYDPFFRDWRGLFRIAREESRRTRKALYYALQVAIFLLFIAGAVGAWLRWRRWTGT